MPYKPSQIGIPVVEVKVNGEKYYFWVDTGAGMTVLSSKVADACMINQNTTVNSIAKTATGNNVSIKPGVIDSLSLGGLNIYNHHCIIIDSKDLEFRILGIRILKIDGILGWNLLQEFDVTINDKTKMLSLATSENNESGENFFWLGKPYVACTDTVGQSLLFFIDTGANSAGLYQSFLDKADKTNAIEKNVHLVSVGGHKKFKAYIFPSLDINAGGQTLVLENVSTLPSSDEALFDIDGVLSMKELKNHIIHFNIYQGFFSISK